MMWCWVIITQVQGMSSHQAYNINNQLNENIISKHINIQSNFELIKSEAKLSLFNTDIQKTSIVSDAKNTHFNLHKNCFQVSKSFFTHLISPVRISGSMQSDLQKGGKRKQFTETNVKLKKLNFEFCHTLNENGGAVFVENCKTEVDTCFFFQGNAINGGGLYATQGSIRILSTNAVKCNSKHNGGAYFFNGCQVFINSGAILSNRAGKEAGAMTLRRSNIEVKGLKIYNNKATEKIGGVKIDQCDGFMNVCYFANNKAREGPNSLFINEGDQIMIVEHVYFYSNGLELEFERKSNVRIVNPIFNGDKTSMKGFGDSTISDLSYAINPRYNGEGIPAQPILPIELLRDVFSWKEIEPDFSWSNLYLIVAILVITFSAILIFVPSLLTPPTKEFNWDQLKE